MFTSVYALGRVTGAGFLPVWVILWGGIYLALSFLLPGNRTGKGARTVLLALLFAELLCDTVWLLVYFPGGHYHNYGVGGVYGVLLWPLLLLIAGGVSAAVNGEEK